MTLPDGWSAGTVHTNGVDLRYYRTGEDAADPTQDSAPPTLVMAHGFYDSGRCWEPVVSALSDDYEIITYDARAHGRSGAPASGYETEDRVADLVGLLDALDIQDPVLFGHSMGATTVAWTAAMHPDRPKAAILEDPAGMLDVPDASPESRVQAVRDRVAEWDERSLAELTAEFDAERGSEWGHNLAVARKHLRPEIAEIARTGYPHSSEAFEGIECPTLVLKADDDPEGRAEDLAVAEELADGRLVHVPGAGHCVFRDEFDAALAEVRTFLRRTA
jgi:pimeloyl-ACP methyl ester carboxylesterase